MCGADRGTHAARRKLEEAIRRYRTEGAKNPGYLKVMRNDVERLRDQLRRGEARSPSSRPTGARWPTRASAHRARRPAGRAARGRGEGRTSGRADRYCGRRRAALRAVQARGRAPRGDRPARGQPPVRSVAAGVALDGGALAQARVQVSEMRAEMSAEPDLSGYNVALPSPRWRPWLIVGGCAAAGGTVGAVRGIVLDVEVDGSRRWRRRVAHGPDGLADRCPPAPAPNGHPHAERATRSRDRAPAGRPDRPR